MNDFNFKAAVSAMFLLSILSTSTGTASTSEDRKYLARAYDLATGEILYTEHHQELWSGGELVGGRVDYRDADGTTFARKELSFERSLFAPSFKMVDERDGFEEGADWSAEGLRLFATRDARTKGTVIESLPESAVIDAGFHRFMQARLPQLSRGERTEFSFAVPSFGRFFRFRVETVGEGPDGSVRLRMKPANAFLRLLSDPIDLVYDARGRLIEFVGVTNIPDDEGERHLARIVFEYPDVQSESDIVAPAG